MNGLSELSPTVEELIMFYNIENFFAPDVKPRHPSDQVSGLRNWNEKRYRNKLHKTAHVFQLVKEECGTLPVLIGLSEVQGNKVLDEIINLKPLEGRYGVIHYESMDERGVDVALLYDKNEIEILDSEPISFVFEIIDEKLDNYDRTRDVLLCKIKYRGSVINVFVCHLPSKREKDVNKPKRNYILRNIKSRIESILAETDEAVLIMGDFNENPGEDNLQELLLQNSPGTGLQNPFEELFRNRIYSTFHYQFGLLFDQIMLSEHFFREDFPLKFADARVFSHEGITSRDKRFKGRPFRTYAGTRYLGGYSDHFPVYVKFNKT